ncbi:hypothetical protein LTR78_002100 [Recurvomyces mirabilis]|uniref:SH3 domain-containing protein n=1 Tax=Recurvomyces mirabilis TaxID=574656 RepID=A0AAE1C4T8_9PEZI|nr:hypothetical protein LTR78_002100 [Recurvomyces mirabilis]KAK5160558.1 hypothetical protein LTS14_001570 [Recurvomyces mirabilis]
MTEVRRHRSKRQRTACISTSTAAVAILASALPATLAQNCVSLASSTACPAFNRSSISTDSTLVGLFPFLSSVSDVGSFDSSLDQYIADGYTDERYRTLIGCSNVNLDNTTAFYARYTASVLCNAIIQNSVTPCGLSGTAARPLCADTCASFAQSEEEIASSNVCGTTGDYALTQIRADFTNCALPADSLTGSCIEGSTNQPNDCGYSSNLGGLCSYCSSSSPNATDSCCVFSNTTTRCNGVTLPIVASSSLAPVTVTASSSGRATASSTSSAGSGIAATNRGLTGGQIAGIVVGSVLGALLLLGLLIAGCLLLRRRRDSSPATSIFNQPATTRSQPAMAFNDGARDGARDQERAGLAVLPGGRVARMSALEGTSSSENDTGRYAPLGYGGYRKSTSDEEETPDSRGMLSAAPLPKRSGSLSSGSQLAIVGAEDSSPNSQNDFTSPESQGQSERLGFFKDYYSQDEIRAGDLVSTLWAYEPRAADEFDLERGDMVKVMGIWDDGWATGVRVRQKAENWRAEDKAQRDSGMSSGSSRTPGSSNGEGEVKAFPLVCVCLPRHWRKTIEGDSTEGSSRPFDLQ